jgi:hypothetical protein
MAMSNPLNYVNRLAARARQESTPSVDTASQVLVQIQQYQPRTVRPLAFMAAGSLALAAGIAVFIVPLIQSITDPLGAVFQVGAGMLP